MKLGTYTPVAGRVEAVNCLRPVSEFVFEFTKKGASAAFTIASITKLLAQKLKISLIDQKTGSETLVVPFVSTSALAEMASYNQGHYLIATDKIIIPVMINPAFDLKLDSDKYLSIDIHNFDVDFDNVTIYAYGTGQQSDIVTVYEKFVLQVGSQNTAVNVEGKELLCIPADASIDTVRLIRTNGSSVEFQGAELKFHQRKMNDLTAVFDASQTGAYTAMYGGYASNYIFSLEGVKMFEVIRTTTATAIEIITANFK